MPEIKISVSLPVADLTEAESVKPLFETFLSENGFKEELDHVFYNYVQEL